MTEQEKPAVDESTAGSSEDQRKQRVREALARFKPKKKPRGRR